MPKEGKEGTLQDPKKTPDICQYAMQIPLLPPLPPPLPLLLLPYISHTAKRHHKARTGRDRWALTKGIYFIQSIMCRAYSLGVVVEFWLPTPGSQLLRPSLGTLVLPKPRSRSKMILSAFLLLR
jgi:hypothetical protein